MMRVEQNDMLAKKAIDEACGVTVAVPFVGLVVMDGEELAGALIFNGWDKWNVDLSCVVLKSWEISCLREIARYTFLKLRARRVTCVTPVSNHKAVNRLMRLGFECEGVLKERFPKGDAFLFGLLASRQKILRLPLGQDSP
jgi:hypothetical protein